MRTEEDRDDKDTRRAEGLALRLYVADDGPNSVRAVANLRAICARCLDSSEYRLEIIDVLQEPARALEAGILVTPTLVGRGRVAVSIVGTLDDHENVRRALGLNESR